MCLGFSQDPKQKWSRNCDPPPFWFQHLHILTVFYLLQLKLLFWGERGHLEVWGMQKFGHSFRKARNAWPRRIMQGLPGPGGAPQTPSSHSRAAAAGEQGAGRGRHALRLQEAQAAGRHRQEEKRAVLVPRGWTREVRTSDRAEHHPGGWSEVPMGHN